MVVIQTSYNVQLSQGKNWLIRANKGQWRMLFIAPDEIILRMLEQFLDTF